VEKKNYLIFFRKNKLIHHVTKIENFKKTIKCGELKYNSGLFNENFPQSKNSYAKYIKCISLFDLTTPNNEQILETIYCWLNIVARINNKIFINFELETISDKLILNRDFKDKATEQKRGE